LGVPWEGDLPRGGLVAGITDCGAVLSFADGFDGAPLVGFGGGAVAFSGVEDLDGVVLPPTAPTAEGTDLLMNISWGKQ
jgi:hypothetical protein